MTDAKDTWDPPQDTGGPDAVETDPAALNSAEDLDEDRLRVDPFEEGMDPPEHWSGVDKYGMTPREEAEARPLAERLEEEQPDLTPEPPPESGPSEAAAITVVDEIASDADDVVAPRSYEQDLGIEADIAGGSVANEIRRPEPSE
ncbi:hypothetical protein [Nocardia sp. NPDC052316]|uniref:hypothetical protein n=1 Tax=Nocardia sp. NPDC052316 TaxID=3364329 RepID=UPI0037CA3ADF